MDGINKAHRQFGPQPCQEGVGSRPAYSRGAAQQPPHKPPPLLFPFFPSSTTPPMDASTLSQTRSQYSETSSSSSLKESAMVERQAYSVLDNGQDRSEHHLTTPDQQATAEVSVDTTETPPKDDFGKKKSGLDWGSSWAWEIGSAALSVVGLALLIAFLVKVDNTPYESWQYTASPNAVVAIITTITKAALLGPISACLSQLKWNLLHNPSPLYSMQVIDQASRGPIGSLEVLLRGIFGFKTGKLTLIGAFLTILALAVDPFAQQIMKFPSRTVSAQNGTAEVQSAIEFYSPQSLFGGELYPRLPPSILTSILSGISQTNRPLEPKCSSGFCKYPEFVTMATCSRCEDVTEQMSQACQAREDSDEEGPFKKTPIDCTYTSPDNFSLAISLEQSARSSSGTEDSFTASFDYWTSRLRPKQPTLGIQKPIISFIAANYSTTMSWNRENALEPPYKPFMTECAMYYCEKKYAASFYKAGNQADLPSHISNTQQLVSNDKTPDGWQYNDDFVYFRPPDGGSLLEDMLYRIDLYSFQSLAATMEKFFNVTVENYVRSLAEREGSGTDPKDIVSTIFRTGNLTQILHSITTSLTDAIRADSRSEGAKGEALRVETYIDVRWPWIILPAIVIIGSIALLLGTVIASEQQRAVLWKASVLPLLSSQLVTTPGNELSSLRNVDQMQDLAMHTQVKLIQEKGPLKIIEER